jgi:hypothetical protein
MKNGGAPPDQGGHGIEQKVEISPMKFVDWDHRPAVMPDRDTAVAVLRRGEPWVSVDSSDVGHTGAELTETAWRARFEGQFGPLDLSLIARARKHHIWFVTWQGRPAVMVAGKVYAVLNQGYPGVWKSVDPSLVDLGPTMTERAWRRMFMGRYGRLRLFRQEDRPTDKEFDDAARALYAADLESKPTKYGFPGVMALVLSRTLQQVADDAGDGQMMLWATDMERRARGVIELYLSCRHPNETAH